ncbi:NAD(P)-binding protein [Amanita muscaria]
MSSIVGFVRRVYKALYPPELLPPPDVKPIKFGILGAAAIAPPALILPAKCHSEVVVYAVAARDKSRSEAFAKKHNIPKAYGGPNGYQELLNDPEIDAIYNPLPNGLHYEWTMRALAAGKHVLLEKPSSDSAEETQKMFEFAESKGLVLLEAFHYRFHPAIQRMKAIIDSGELGAIKHVEANLVVPPGVIKGEDNIRYNYELGGGALMDMGCYTLNCIRYLSSSNPVSVLSASHDLYVPRHSPPSFASNMDRGSTATLELPNDVTAQINCDLSQPGFKFPRISAKVECEGGSIEIFNFVMPVIYHSITVQKRGQSIRTEKAYTFEEGKMEGKGEDWWTTYRYQLEAFVDKLRGRTPQTWLNKEDAIANMEWIERVYEKTGLGSRPRSTYTA